jgi:hypothetical protein
MTTTDARPGSVTLVAVLCAVFGVLEIVAGALALIFLPALAESADATATQLGWSAAVLVVLGIAYFFVSLGLFRGRDVARVIVFLVSLVHAVNGVWLFVSGQAVSGILTLAVAIVVTAALWTGSGAKFFERRSLVE